ncbi:hypothetical protein, partial [Butyricicoccus sp.]|uniref:hypothetical protein n=1 Tax=Butyricicoccus sp. TaxID=2049021 RepID=UPI003D7CF3FC
DNGERQSYRDMYFFIHHIFTSRNISSILLYEKKFGNAKAEVPKIVREFFPDALVLFHKTKKLNVSQDNKKIPEAMRKTAEIRRILSQQNRRKRHEF